MYGTEVRDMSRTTKPRVPREDFFESPPWVVQAIYPHLPAAFEVLDPCAGRGAILAEIGRLHDDANQGRAPIGLVGYELNPERAAECRDNLRPPRAGIVEVANALDANWLAPPLVVMNPPYSQAEAFVRKALAEVARGGSVFALLRLGFLASAKRRSFHRQHPCDVYVLSRRPSFTGGGSDATDYGWFAFGPGRGGRWFSL